MGLGRKVFGSETLSSAEVQGYLMDQSVMVFTGTAQRAAELPAPAEGMVCVLTDTDQVQQRRNGAWIDLGAVPPVAVTLDGTKLANFGGGIRTARVWAQGRTVFCSGLVKMLAAQGTTLEVSVATIPAGFRPVERETFPTLSSAAPLRLDVYPTGDVKLVTFTTALAINATWPFVGHWNLD
jgi:hypothetical protein